MKDWEYKGESYDSDEAQGLCMDHKKGMIPLESPRAKKTPKKTLCSSTREKLVLLGFGGLFLANES